MIAGWRVVALHEQGGVHAHAPAALGPLLGMVWPEQADALERLEVLRRDLARTRSIWRDAGDEVDRFEGVVFRVEMVRR